MRIYHPTVDVSVAYLDQLRAKVNIYWDENRIVVQQPQYLGGRLERTLDDYTEFDGDLAVWVKHLRAVRA